MIKTGKYLIMIFLSYLFLLLPMNSSVNAMPVEIGDPFEFNLSVASITESSENIYVRDNETLYYNDKMSSAQSLSFQIDVKYNGTSNISHVNTTTSWWGDSPSDSSEPYQLTFDIESSDTQNGSMIISVWTNDNHTTNVTVSVILDNISPDILPLAFLPNSTIPEPISTTTPEDTTSDDHRMTSDGTTNIKPSDPFTFDLMTTFSVLTPVLLGWFGVLFILLKYEKMKKQRKCPFEDIYELLMELEREFD